MMKLPFSKARMAGDQLWLAGELGFEDDGGFAADITLQTDRMMQRVQVTLRSHGYELSDVISCTVYLTDATLFAAFNEAYASWFQEPLPVRATVQAGMMAPGALVEISVVAHKDPTDET